MIEIAGKGNSSLIEARKKKNDEFYTLYEDVQKGVELYRDYFKGKRVLCNCNNSEKSNFYKYFTDHFKDLGLKELVCTTYSSKGRGDKIRAFLVDGELKIEKTQLEGNGDYASEECIALLDECDIVCDNPPFSCYSGDTEVKTNNGWKLIKDVDIDKDTILSVNPETFEMEYVKAIDKLQQRVDGNLLHFKNRHMDLLVTGNHRMWAFYRTSGGEMKSVSRNLNRLPFAQEIKPTWKLPVEGFKYKSNKTLEIVLPSVKQLEQYTRKEIIVPEKHIDLKAWLEFFGFWLADGCWRDHINVYGKRDYTINIKQNEKNEEYVLKLFEGIGYTPKIYKNKKTGNHNYCVYSKQLWEFLRPFGRSDTKYIPQEYLDLPTEYLECLLRGYENGDSYGNESSFCYSSRSKRLMDNIQELLLKIYGHLWEVRTVNATYKGEPYIYYQILLSKKMEHCKFSKYRKPEAVDYHGDVYCLELEKNGVMLVRRGDFAAWSGNCFRHYIKLLEEHNKKYLVLGNLNTMITKEIFPLIKDGKAWVVPGKGSMKFEVPEDSVA